MASRGEWGGVYKRQRTEKRVGGYYICIKIYEQRGIGTGDELESLRFLL